MSRTVAIASNNDSAQNSGVLANLFQELHNDDAGNKLIAEKCEGEMDHNDQEALSPITQWNFMLSPNNNYFSWRNAPTPVSGLFHMLH